MRWLDMVSLTVPVISWMEDRFTSLPNLKLPVGASCTWDTYSLLMGLQPPGLAAPGDTDVCPQQACSSLGYHSPHLFLTASFGSLLIHLSAYLYGIPNSYH